MQTRTKRQREVLDFLVKYIDSHGYEPSYQVIARHLGLSSKAGIAKHIKSLEDQGALTRNRDNGHFSLEIIRNAGEALSETRIAWLNIKNAVSDGQPWNDEPFSLPGFLFGTHDPESIYAFRVRDDSMAERSIFDGDIALIELGSHFRDGDCVAAVVSKKTAMIRNYYRDGAAVELRAADQQTPTIRLSAEKVEILGVFRGLLRPLS
ncbi:MAG: S24 family peptidase [Pyrinomonadaceae bacterium]